MSEQLRHKMIDFEVQPPLTAWQSIAARLDDDSNYAAVSSKLNSYETPPPPTVWKFIGARLDDDNNYAVVSAKMNGFQVIPPSTAWQSIAARLHDDGNFAVVSSKMNNFEAAPPPFLWERITTALDEKKQEAPVIGIKNTRRIIYRALAAAVIIGVLAGAWMLFNKNATTTNDLAKTVVPAPPPVKENTNHSKDTVQNIPVVTPAVETAILPRQTARQQTINGNHFTGDNDDRIIKYAMVSPLPRFPEAPITITAAPVLDENGHIIHDMDVLTTSNYIMVTGPNGQLTRMSSKFASVIRYLNGGGDDTEEYLDKVIKESDTWKKRFQEWRSKISQSSFIPSSANFLDIIEFKELIQEKQ